METPTSNRRDARPMRTYTPRLSERKRQLFRSRNSMIDQPDDDSDADDPLMGLTPLKPTRQSKNSGGSNKTNTDSVMTKHSIQNDTTLRHHRSSTSTSPETNKENKRASSSGGIASSTDEQLPQLFTATMRLNSNGSNQQIIRPRTPKTRARAALCPDSSTDSDGQQTRKAVKRSHDAESSTESDLASPEAKMLRNQKNCIPTMAFYSHTAARRSGAASAASSSSSRTDGPKPKRKGKVTPPRVGINKGVRHKIRKPQRQIVPTILDDILGRLRNEKLRQLITTKREERAQAEQVHKILRSAKDPIQMAKPLNVLISSSGNDNNNNTSHSAFSDFSDDEVPKDMPMSTMEPVIPLIRHSEPLNTSPESNPEALSKRKFFKSGRRSSTCMEVRITDNIRASVTQGKIELVEAPIRQRKVKVKSATIFSAEQATVDAILRNLDDTVVDEIVESQSHQAKQTDGDLKSTVELACEEVKQENNTAMMQELIKDPSQSEDPFMKYRQQLPYQTDDPATIEQQALLLEFLITNNICTDENFEIFITDPENHKAEATRIVDELYVVVNAEMENLASSAPSPQVENLVSSVPTPDTQTPPLYPIFTRRQQPLPQKSTRRRVTASGRLMAVAASGAGQYQIDAGQKAFGAKQCQHCGLVYTVHEPEEEQLHHEYHNAIHVLRFKGWIDEDIVAVFPGWGSDGRIIRINEHAPATRLQRLTDLIKVVDKELGYSSYIVPKTFVAFIAVRKQQIVGLCLVQPLQEAYRFMQVDGTDYFSQETFEASCGVSRIWVAPLQRRRKIATHLLRAVQCHTILGTEISRERIAFSTPTDDGRELARHFTRNENFLAYDQ